MLVIFDCDGVLVDSETLVSAVHVAHLRRAGYAIDEAQLIERFLGTTDRAMIAAIEGELGHALPADYPVQVKQEVRARAGAELRAVPGARDAADAMTCAVCVASSSAEEQLHFKLETTGLAGIFGEAVFSADRVERGKPAPDVFLYAAARTGWQPEQCVVIEDSVNGVRAGRAAGMRVLGFTGAGHLPQGYDEALIKAGAEAVANDYASLRALLPEAFAPYRNER
ncbi:6-phosphogluconate phosphatase [Alteriqipengyuania sp. 357]